MTTEPPSKNEGPSTKGGAKANGADGEKCNPNPNDLNKGSSKPQHLTDHHHHHSQSPRKSPTKQSNTDASPNKSTKNKKRNEARRRNANQRKQQQPTTTTNSKDDNQDQGDQDDRDLSAVGGDGSESTTVSPSPSPIAHKSIVTLDNTETATRRSLQPETNDEDDHKINSSDDRQPSKSGASSSGQPTSGGGATTDKDKSRETWQLKAKNLLVQNLVDKLRNQANKLRELETALLSTTKTCNQLESLLQQELASRNKLEAEADNQSQTITRLKSQVSAYEKNKSQNDELIRVLNATLMERETEVSILKLKLTRLQTNPSSNIALNSNTSINSMRQEPHHVFSTTGRSNSEFNRNSYIRSSMMAEAASATRLSATHLKSERDASVWATVPEELTPSKRPLLLERTFQPIYNEPLFCHHDLIRPSDEEPVTPITRDRRYRTLPRSMKSPSQEFKAHAQLPVKEEQKVVVLNDNPSRCQVTNLDDSNSTNQSSDNRTVDSSSENKHQSSIDKVVTASINSDATQAPRNTIERVQDETLPSRSRLGSTKEVDSYHYSTITKVPEDSRGNVFQSEAKQNEPPPSIPERAPTTPIKISSGLKKILGKFRRSGSSQSRTDLTDITATPTKSPFKRGGNRTTLVGTPSDIRAHMSPIRQTMNFQTDKPFAEWDTDMLVDWLTMIGLSMYAQQCRRWVKCGAHIMNATPAEVDKGLGITNHLHRKKLRLAISELNGDCDKITKAAAKLDYLWVARWLDDIGLPQYKEAFINARIDGRVLNYLTVDDLLGLGVKSVLHHSSIKCGIRVLRSIEFDLQLLKRRATADEVDQLDSTRQRLNQVTDNLTSTPLRQEGDADLVNQLDVPLWTCHKVMEWLRMIDFAEFAPNLRGSGVHGGLIIFEDGFNIDTMCALLSIPIGRTLLRRHLSTFFNELIGGDLASRKRQYQDCPDRLQINLTAEIKTAKKTQWLQKLRGSKVTHDNMDDYLCPMYPVEPQIIKTTTKSSTSKKDSTYLPGIAESINV